MGRKKRPAASATVTPPDPSAYPSSLPSSNQIPPPNKKQNKNGSTPSETYLVKKYRPDQTFRSIDAFAKYTKNHRMLDAAFVRVSKGSTPEKPFIFATRVGGVHLGWGRGKTRDAAIDCACRAAFVLVQAHGYEDFTMDEDCLTTPPEDSAPPPPPPPPPPPGGMPPLPPGIPPPGMSLGLMGMPPPLPPGFPPFPPPGVGFFPPHHDHVNAPPPTASLPQLIPQVKEYSSELPVASTRQEKDGTVNKLSLSTVHSAQQRKEKETNKTKNGLTLVFVPDDDDKEETCAEERRGKLSRYMGILHTVLQEQIPVS